MSQADRDRLGAYVAHFNARDFDAIRAMIADDVRLELVNKTRMNGKAEVSRYFGNYRRSPIGIWCRDWWRAVPRSWCSIPASRVRRRNISCCCDWSADKVADHPRFPPRALRHRWRGISRLRCVAFRTARRPNSPLTRAMRSAATEVVAAARRRIGPARFASSAESSRNRRSARTAAPANSARLTRRRPRCRDAQARATSPGICCATAMSTIRIAIQSG